MKLNTELFKYISTSFLYTSGVLILFFSAIIFIGDLVEYNKKLASYDSNNISLVFLLSLLNLPKMLQEILPFCLLFSGMLWALRINDSKELLVIRASGLPVRKFC